MPHSSARVAARHRRIDRDHDPVRRDRRPRPRRVEHRPRPERARRRRSRTRRRAPPARGWSRRSFAVTAVDEARRQMHPVRRRRRPRHRRPRRRRPAPRSSGLRAGVVVTTARGRSPEPQRELQHVPGVARPSPTCRPRRTRRRRTAARAATLGIARREDLRHRAVRPHQPPPARLPLGPPVRRRAGHDPGGAEDHDLPRLVERLSDQGDPGTRPRVARLAPFDLRADPFGARAGLACPPAAQDDPGRPVSLGRQLVSQRPSARRARAGTSGHSDSSFEEAVQLTVRQPRQQVSQRLPRVRRRGRARCPPLRRLLWCVFQDPPRCREPSATPSGARGRRSAVPLPSLPVPASRSVIRSLRATVRSRYNASLRSSRSLSAAASAEIVMCDDALAAPPGPKQKRQAQGLPTHFFQLALSIPESERLSTAKSQVAARLRHARARHRPLGPRPRLRPVDLPALPLDQPRRLGRRLPPPAPRPPAAPRSAARPRRWRCAPRSVRAKACPPLPSATK